MALNADMVSQVKAVIAKANDIYLLFPENANLDIVASTLALAGGLSQSGKAVYVGSPADLDEKGQQLPLSNLVTTKIGNRNLVISLKVGSRDNIDKVSYNLDDDGSVFNLIIQPKKGQPPLKSDAVSFSYAGAQADLVIIVGASRLEDLGTFYEDERKLFSETPLIGLHRYTAQKFAQYHLDDSRAGSLSEITYKLMHDLDLKNNKDTATNLLIGIDQATNNLTSPTVTPDTFEAVANLMRLGGVRRSLSTTENVSPTSSVPVTPAPTPVPALSAPTPVSVPSPAPATTNGNQNDNQNGNQPVPQEWLQPKIYKSSGSNQ